MQNPIPELIQKFIIYKKPGFLPQKSKALTSSNYHRIQYFLLKICTRFLLTNVYKRVFGISFILFISRAINKNVKNECVETRSFYFLQITQDLNKNKKTRTYRFVDIGK